MIQFLLSHLRVVYVETGEEHIDIRHRYAPSTTHLDTSLGEDFRQHLLGASSIVAVGAHHNHRDVATAKRCDKLIGELADIIDHYRGNTPGIYRETNDQPIAGHLQLSSFMVRDKI